MRLTGRACRPMRKRARISLWRRTGASFCAKSAVLWRWWMERSESRQSSMVRREGATPTHAEKGRIFRSLHDRASAFIIPNPWDRGSARLLAHLGFEALASTSMGYAFSAGQRDGTVTRDEMMTHIFAIATATDLPLSADLENG